MILAKSHKAGPRIYPSPGIVAVCPTCESECVAKCGSVNAWHWAHRSRVDCDSWSEGETPWHAWWKGRVADEFVEVGMGPHRADIRLETGLVIELQHSAISPEDIEAREAFYGHMIWILDGDPFRDRFELRRREGHHTFRWKSPRRSFFRASKSVVIDFGPRVFVVKKMHAETPCGGWGHLYPKKEILRRLDMRPMAPAEASKIAAVEVGAMGSGFYFDKTYSSVAEARRHVASVGAELRRLEVFMADGTELDAESSGRLWGAT